ncbi:CcdB family protein [uncultured Sphingomonas sp.]|uniref:CcdB family protein n=1 Tax=uncultured Sphingomonas sp. TaxID=158754 RepID=UPI002625D410|nr:CcdB family protein [uncultured Sphingomonas sp.]
MAKFDVYPAPDGGYWLDCQSNLLSDLNSRFVVPLHPYDVVRGEDRKLNPVLIVNGREYVMRTHFAAAVPTHLLRKPTGTLIEHEYTVSKALDMLINGF